LLILWNIKSRKLEIFHSPTGDTEIAVNMTSLGRKTKGNTRIEHVAVSSAF
jgi:hypothetical protein